MKRRTLTLTFLLTATLTAGAQSAARQQIVNTGVAVGNELLYTAPTDSIKRDMMMTITFATMRHQLKMAEKESRESILYDRNSQTYHEMVFQCSELTREMNQFKAEADSCAKDVSDAVDRAEQLYEEAREITLDAVVTGMSSNVPDPWKVDYDKLKDGKDETPIYALDPDRPEWREDGDNMLFPDERVLITDNAIQQVRAIRRALQVIRLKITVDFDIRTRMKRAPKLCQVTCPASERALQQWSKRIAAMAK